MARRVIVLVVVVVVVAIWWLRRDRSPAPAPQARPMASVTQRPAVSAAAPPAPVEGLRLEGQVIDEDQHAVAGLTVRLIGTDRTVVSEQDGAFAFGDLSAGGYRLIGDSETLATDEVKAQLTATSEPVILRARRAGTAVVTVLDAVTHSAIMSAEVSDDHRTFVTDAAGRARVTGLLGDVKLEVKAREHSPAFARTWGGHEVTVELARGASVSGKVVGPDGAPVPGAEVEIEGKSWTGHVRCDLHGAWRIEALAKGAYELTGSSELYTETDSVSLKVDGSTPRTDVVVPVELGFEMTGMVVDFDNQPVGGAVVHLDSSSYEPITTTSDGAGHFHLVGLPHARFDLWASEGNRVSIPSVASEFQWPGEPVVLAISPSPFAGVVVERTGEPVADIKLALRVGATPFETRTDSEGHFDFGGLPAGHYTVSVTGPLRWAGPFDLVAPSTELRIVLPPKR